MKVLVMITSQWCTTEKPLSAEGVLPSGQKIHLCKTLSETDKDSVRLTSNRSTWCIVAVMAVTGVALAEEVVVSVIYFVSIDLSFVCNTRLPYSFQVEFRDLIFFGNLHTVVESWVLYCSLNLFCYPIHDFTIGSLLFNDTFARFTITSRLEQTTIFSFLICHNIAR